MISIVNFGSTKTQFISDFVSACGYVNVILPWQETTENKLWDSEAIIFSGSPEYLTEISHKPYHDRFGFIKNSNIPVLGICFGHQVLGILYGANIFRGQEIRREVDVKILKEDPLFKGFTSSLKMTEDHTEGITLPAGFHHLASSKEYPVEAMKHGSKKIWSVQFHPEVSGNDGLKIFKNFFEAAL